MASAARAATVVTWSGMAARSASTGSRASGPRTVRQAPSRVTVAPIASSSAGRAASGCRVAGSALVTVTLPPVAAASANRWAAALASYSTSRSAAR